MYVFIFFLNQLTFNKRFSYFQCEICTSAIFFKIQALPDFMKNVLLPKIVTVWQHLLSRALHFMIFKTFIIKYIFINLLIILLWLLANKFIRLLLLIEITNWTSWNIIFLAPLRVDLLRKDFFGDKGLLQLLLEIRLS